MASTIIDLARITYPESSLFSTDAISISRCSVRDTPIPYSIKS